ncbi:MAG: MFS transporter, partial [Deltaproteobacteria bacterium]
MTKPKFFYGYVITASGFMIWMFGFGTFTTVFSIFFKPLLIEFGWSRAEMALAITLSTIVQAFMIIVVGGLTDKLGPRIVVTALGSFLGISYLLLSRVTALWQFQLSYALVGAVGVSVLAVPVMATVSRWFVKARGFMSGIVQAGLGIGGILFSPLSGWLILGYGWRTAYVVLGTLTLGGIIISGLFLRRDPREMGLQPDGDIEEPITSENPKHTIDVMDGMPFRSL